MLSEAAGSSLKTSSALRNVVAATSLSPSTNSRAHKQKSSPPRRAENSSGDLPGHRPSIGPWRHARAEAPARTGSCFQHSGRWHSCRRPRLARTRLSLNCRFRRPWPWRPRRSARARRNSDRAPRLSHRRSLPADSAPCGSRTNRASASLRCRPGWSRAGPPAVRSSCSHQAASRRVAALDAGSSLPMERV